MDFINGIYRNPPPPPGYVKKQPSLIVKPKDCGERINIHNIIQMILDSKICDEPDVSIYEDFVINPGLEDEEVLKIPFASVPKVIEVLDTTENSQNDDSLRDTVISDNEHPSSAKTETSVKDSVLPVEDEASRVTETSCHKSFIKVKKHKKHVSKKNPYKKSKSSSRRKHKKKYNYDKDDDSYSTSSGDTYSSSRRQRIKRSHSSDSDSCSKSPLKKRDNYGSDSKYQSRSQYKKFYGSDSDFYSRSRHRKKESCSSDNDYHKERDKEYVKKEISQCIKKEIIIQKEISSDSDSNDKSKYRKRSYSNDMDSFSGNKQKKGDIDSDSHRSNKKEDSYEENHSDKELSDSNCNVSKGQNKQLSDFKKDDSKTKPKSDIIFVRIDKKQLTSSQSTSSENSTKKQENSSNINTEESFLYGDYRCKICKISTTNETTYKSHMEGKKHKKMLESIQSEAAAKQAKKKALISFEIQGQPAAKLPILPLPTPPSSKYPAPIPGYSRIKLDCLSVIQNHLDENFPLPGLHKVIEIRCANETTYYCSLCDSNCSYNSIEQHLRGYKHQLSSLKYFRRDLYDQWNYKPKYLIQHKLLDALSDEERRHGRGLIRVELDVRDTDNINTETRAAVSDLSAHNNPSTSTQNQEYREHYLNSSIPDPSKPGFYCRLCQCECNSEPIWNNHIVGKRHLGNLKKLPGIAPSKCKYIPAKSNVRPVLFDIIKEENEYKLPIVGLVHIREIRKPDINGVMYNCSICGGCLSSSEIFKHIISNKHRQKYLNVINHPAMEALKDCTLSEHSRSSILEDICGRLEAEEGCGRPEVCYAKSSIIP